MYSRGDPSSRTPSTLGIMSPSYDDGADVVSVVSSSDTNGPSPSTLRALQARNQTLVKMLQNLSEEHKDVSMKYATLLRRMESVEDSTSTTSVHRDHEGCSRCVRDKGLLETLTTALEELATTVESLKADKKKMSAELDEAREINDSMARYVAQLEVTNDQLSLELDALLKQRPLPIGHDTKRTAADDGDQSTASTYVYGDEALRAATTSCDGAAVWPMISFIPSVGEQVIEDRANALLIKGRWLRDRCTPKKAN